MRVRSLGCEDPLEEGLQPTPVFLPGKFHGQRSLVGSSPWGRTESDTTECMHAHTHTHTHRVVVRAPHCERQPQQKQNSSWEKHKDVTFSKARGSPWQRLSDREGACF